MAKIKDSLTLDMFEVPQPADDIPGSMDYSQTVSGLVSRMLKDADGDRFDVAARMSRLADKEVTKHMLDAYASESRDNHNMPFYLVPVLESACSSYELTSWLADVRGGRLLVGRDVLHAQLGKMERMKESVARQIRDLKKHMGEME